MGELAPQLFAQEARCPLCSLAQQLDAKSAGLQTTELGAELAHRSFFSGQVLLLAAELAAQKTVDYATHRIADIAAPLAATEPLRQDHRQLSL
jgi:hypothetical protein